MKKNILSIALILGLWVCSANAQEITKTAVLHSNGNVTVGAPKESANKQNVVSNSDQHAFVSHEAVLLKDGTQEIRLTDASGKVTVISAAKGESVQAKYIDYLVKNHLPCACGGSASEKEEPAKTATRPSQAVPDSMKK